MRATTLLAFVACSAAFAQTVGAQTQAALPGLLSKNACTACHAIDRKAVGPALKDVAARYRGDKAAWTKLAAKIKAGGAGVWGSLPMPPQPTIKDEELRLIVKDILELVENSAPALIAST